MIHIENNHGTVIETVQQAVILGGQICLIGSQPKQRPASGDASQYPFVTDAAPELRTPQAQCLLRKAQEGQWLDEQLQPLCSRTTAALLANEIAGRLGISRKWAVFEQLWHLTQLSRYYDKALSLQSMPDTLKKIEASLA